MIKSNKHINIGTFDIDVKEFAAHETPEFVAKRIQEAMVEVLKEYVDQQAKNGFFDLQPITESNGVSTVNNASFATNIGSSVKKTGKTTSGQVNLSISGRSSTNNLSTIEDNDISVPDDFDGIDSPINIISGKGPDIVPKVKNDKKRLLIEKIREKYLIEESEYYDASKVKTWSDIIDQIQTEPNLKQFVETSDNIELAALYNEVVLESKPVKELTPQLLRKRMIKEIEEKFLADTTLDEDKKTYWDAILEKLKNADIALAEILNEHQELFLFLDLITPEFDTISKALTTITADEAYSTFRKVYPKLGTQQIYLNLKDNKGESTNKGDVVFDGSKGNLFALNSVLKFKLKTKATDRSKFNNWIVYKKLEIEGKVSYETVEIAVDKGTNFEFLFDEAGNYVVECYGSKPYLQINKKYTAYLEFRVKAPGLSKIEIVENRSIIRPEESLSFTALSDVGKPENLPPLTWKYYLKNSKTKKYPTEGIIIPTFTTDVTFKTKAQLFKEKGRYKIEACTGEGDDKRLVQLEINVGNNWVTSIQERNDKDWILINTKDSFQFTVNGYRIEPANDKEKKEVKWIVTKNDKPYILKGYQLQETEKSKKYLKKGDCFDLLLNEEGLYGVEAYMNSPSGSGSARKNIRIIYPQVSEPMWTDTNGNKKTLTGLDGTDNYIKAHIPYFGNQKVGIHFYAGNKRITKQPFITKTGKDGNINYKVVLTEGYRKQLTLTSKKEAKLRFELQGLIGSTPYIFKKPTYDINNTEITVSTEDKITDAYFVWNGKRITNKDKVPYGETVEAVVETINMVGKKVTINIYRDRLGFDAPFDQDEVTVDKTGKATRKFKLKVEWYEWDPLARDKFYIGTEEVHGINWIRSDETFENNALVATDEKIKKVKKPVQKKVRSNFEKYQKEILDNEGGYVNDPDDPGGETNKGITIGTFKKFAKKDLGIEPTSENLKNLTDEQAAIIYKNNYWNIIKGDLILNASLAFAIYDFYVNAGTNAIKVLQKTLKSLGKSIKSDGNFGDSTLHAINTSDAKKVFDLLQKNRKQYYKDIIAKNSKLKKYENGWMNRVDSIKFVEQTIISKTAEEALKAMPLYEKYKNYTLKKITSGYGPRNPKVGSKFHKGLDLNYSGGGNTDIGAPVIATHDGYVFYAKDNPSGTGGRFVVVRSNDQSFQTRYLHLSKMTVKKDQKIKKGQKLGELGASYKGKEISNEISAHLHYEIMSLVGDKMIQIDPTQGMGKHKEFLVDPQNWIDNE